MRARAPAPADRGRRGAARRARRDRRRGDRPSPCDLRARSPQAPCSSSGSTGAPIGVRPMLPIAAAQPPGEPTRLDIFRGGVARSMLERLAGAEEDRELGDALDRWELSLFQDAPFRAEQLRSSLDALLGAGDGSWAAALRAAVLLGENGRERGACLTTLRRLGEGVADVEAGDLVRRALVETLGRGDRLQARRRARRVPARRARPGLRAALRMRLQADSDLAHLRATSAPLAWKRWRSERAILEGLERIDGLRREDAPAGRAARRRALPARGCGGLGAGGSGRAAGRCGGNRALQRGARGGRNAPRNGPRNPLTRKTPANSGESCSTSTFCCTMDACRTARSPVELGTT